MSLRYRSNFKPMLCLLLSDVCHSVQHSILQYVLNNRVLTNCSLCFVICVHCVVFIPLPAISCFSFHAVPERECMCACTIILGSC